VIRVSDPLLLAIADKVRATRGLELLLLFGSRARGDAGPHSDWDFGYAGSPALDVAGLMAVLNDRAVLAERAMALEPHLAGIAAQPPAAPEDLRPSTDAADAVVLHLWQATQIVIDVAMAACLALDLGTPSSYGDAFRRLEAGGVVGAKLANRLVRAAGFRNVVAHAYEGLDMMRVHDAALHGPADLRGFIIAIRDRTPAAPDP
jgi:uncharacterized protein YutE (UPF0331/DUF86 family)